MSGEQEQIGCGRWYYFLWTKILVYCDGILKLDNMITFMYFCMDDIWSWWCPINEVNLSMTMSHLPAATRCVSDGVNNISLTNCIYEWAVSTRHTTMCRYDWNNSRRGENITLSKIHIYLITQHSLQFKVKGKKSLTDIKHKFLFFKSVYGFKRLFANWIRSTFLIVYYLWDGWPNLGDFRAC